MSTSRFGLVLDRVFLEHRNPPGHPERPERLETLLERLGDLGETEPKVLRVEPVGLEEELLRKVHSQRLVAQIRATAGNSLMMIDPDTHAGGKSFETACLAAGSGVRLVELVASGRIRGGFLLARPPGHHAETDRAMGFCLFNNVAVAAQWAIDHGAARKVAIVDFDVHHGNGTQEIFWKRNDVLYISSHQFPLYPGTGRFGEVGEEAGRGFTVNFPLPAGSDDGVHVAVYRELVVPVLREFGADLLLVSAGFDSHREDPLASMEMTAEGFAALVDLLQGVAEEICGGRMILFLEGGYNLQALGDSVRHCLEVVIEGRPGKRDWGRSAAFQDYWRQALRQLGPYWKSLAPVD